LSGKFVWNWREVDAGWVDGDVELDGGFLAAALGNCQNDERCLLPAQTTAASYTIRDI
jgi:hypothetical protein